jgi:hypothetical protein
VGIRSYSNPIYVNLPPQKEPSAPGSGAASNSARDDESERLAPPVGAPTSPTK